MYKERLSELKKILKDQKIDFFILPNSDEFFSEYLQESEKRIQYLTGFSGSNAQIVVGLEKSYFFTDGRYVLQAKNELDQNEFEIFNVAEKSVLFWFENDLEKNKTLALDSKLSSINFIKSCEKIAERNSTKLVFLEQNPIDKIWQNRPPLKNSEVFFCDLKLTGVDSVTKRNQVLQGLEADAMIITKPENLCWLLNIRAADVEFSPLLLAYGILFRNGEVDLFIDEKRLSKVAENDLPKVNFVQVNCFDLRISVLRKKFKKIQIDASTTNHWLHEQLQKNNFEIILKTDPIEILKACKNSTEINGMIKSHEADGLAVTKFLFWLEEVQKNGEAIDEISAQEKLLKFRKEDPNFLYPSFASISGFASNGAVIHYRATDKSNKKISGNSLYLIDSGGQYFGKDFFGTTDITRTIAIGKPSYEMIENFTRVLKGHIALARAKFPVGISGAHLDVLARSHLWQAQRDYDHGTGHGVGSFLSVHEGPQAISRRSSQVLIPGMILSNEPGFYVDGEYGIRIESLMLVEKIDEKFLGFKTLTLAPIDPSLIDFKMLTWPERKWLFEYHQMILDTMKSRLNADENLWLQNLVKKFNDFFSKK